MPRRKAPVRERDAFAAPHRVVVRCECGKRLAEQWKLDQPGSRVADGHWYVPTRHGTYVEGEDRGVSRAAAGLKFIGAEDWRQVSCPSCGREWEGREWQVDVLVVQAANRGLRNVLLSAALTARLRTPAPGPSRDW